MKFPANKYRNKALAKRKIRGYKKYIYEQRLEALKELARKRDRKRKGILQ